MWKLTGKMAVICMVALAIFASAGLHAASSAQNLTPHTDKASGKVGYADKDGKLVIPGKYETAMEFVDDLAFVRLNKKWGMIDKTGKTVVPHKYDMLGISIRNGKFEAFTEGFARVQLGDKWGYIDKAGNEIAPCIYDKAEDFSNGKAKVTLNNETFNIDKSGNRVNQ